MLLAVYQILERTKKVTHGRPKNTKIHCERITSLTDLMSAQVMSLSNACGERIRVRMDTAIFF